MTARGEARLRECLLVKTVAVPLKDRPELFLVPNETMYAIEASEVVPTYADMVQLDIAKLPYSRVDIGVQASLVLRLSEDGNENSSMEGRTVLMCGEELRQFTEHPRARPMDDWQVTFRFRDEKLELCFLISDNGVYLDLYKFLEERRGDIVAMAETVRRILIVLLATRNSVKERTKDKLLAVGIGAKRNAFRPLYTTTITIPGHLTQPSVIAEATGAKRRPHLRRGHIRHQLHGPGLKFVKIRWIEPIFVNADAGFVSARTAYNTSLKQEA